MDILACPMCKNYPLTLHTFEEKNEVISGILECHQCHRWYPIIDEIPHMLPDDLRNKKEELQFLIKWKKNVPSNILEEGKPYTIK